MSNSGSQTQRVIPGQDATAIGGATTVQPGHAPEAITGQGTITPNTADAKLANAEKKAGEETPVVVAGDKAAVKPGEEKTAGEQPKVEAPVPGSFEALAEPFTKEFTDSGTLKPESVAAAAKQFNVTEEAVMTYLKGLGGEVDTAKNEAGAIAIATAKIAKVAYDALSSPGKNDGEANYTNFAAWARTNLPANVQQSIDNALAQAHVDPVPAQSMLARYYGQFKMSGGDMPRDVTKQGGSASAVVNPAGFPSRAAMVKAMNDPSYRRGDPEVVAAVDAKVIASNFA